jgi:hypothetical protein
VTAMLLRGLKLVVLASLAVGAACTKEPPRPTEKRHTEPSLGFSFVVPEGWAVDPNATETYRAFLANAAAADAGLTEISQRQREVASVGRRDAQGRILGRLSIFAAQASPKELIDNYLFTLGGDVTIDERKDEHEIQGKRYELARLTVSLGPRKLTQEVFATTAKGEGVLFTLTAADPGALADLKAMMWSTKWEK